MSTRFTRAIQQRGEVARVSERASTEALIALDRMVAETAGRHWSAWVKAYGVEAARDLWRQQFPNRVLPG